MDNSMLGGLVRAGVAAGGGGLIANGLATSDELSVIAGAITALIVGAWSIWVKYRAAKK